jgi:hypothetical protein
MGLLLGAPHSKKLWVWAGRRRRENKDGEMIEDEDGKMIKIDGGNEEEKEAEDEG